MIRNYETALSLYRARRLSEAFKIVAELKIAAPHWKKPFLLETFIRREQGEFVKEFELLARLLPRFDLDKPEEKTLAAEALSVFGAVNRTLGNIAEAVESFCLSAALEVENKKSCVEISNALFTANSSENFTAKDFQTLYDKYKKYLADIKPYPRRFYEHEKIRVGLLSSDFQWHVVMAWSWALITELDKNHFETYCYSNVQTPDDVTEHFQKTAQVWRNIFNLTDAQAAEF